MGVLFCTGNGYKGELCIPNQGFNAFLVAEKFVDGIGLETTVNPPTGFFF